MSCRTCAEKTKKSVAKATGAPAATGAAVAAPDMAQQWEWQKQLSRNGDGVPQAADDDLPEDEEAHVQECPRCHALCNGDPTINDHGMCIDCFHERDEEEEDEDEGDDALVATGAAVAAPAHCIHCGGYVSKDGQCRNPECKTAPHYPHNPNAYYCDDCGRECQPKPTKFTLQRPWGSEVEEHLASDCCGGNYQTGGALNYWEEHHEEGSEFGRGVGEYASPVTEATSAKAYRLQQLAEEHSDATRQTQ